jgi:hypothetical protein
MLFKCTVNRLARPVGFKRSNTGHGKPGINTSVDGKPITIAGDVFKRGFGTHAESSLLIKLNGKAKAFPQWWEWMMK